MSRELTLAQRAPASMQELAAAGDHAVKTGMLPEHIKTGWQFAVIASAGHEMGMPPMRAIRSLAMVKGKVIESADSQLARFKADGGRSQFEVLDDTRAVLHLVHPNGDKHTETFTMEDARRAGLEGNANYKKFPRAMLRSRAITAGLKSIGWEGAVGNYDPDELPPEPAAAAEPVVYRPMGTKPAAMTVERLAEVVAEKAAAQDKPTESAFVRALNAVGKASDLTACEKVRDKAHEAASRGRMTEAELGDIIDALAERSAAIIAQMEGAADGR